MSKLIKLILLYGGKSGEHEISLISAASVLAHLNPEIYHIIPIAMDKEGGFHLHQYQDLLTYPNALPVVTENSQILSSFLINGQPAVAADIVFPIVHGPLYEDGCLQGLLELAGVAYVGCDVLGSAIGMDKDVARRLACHDDLQCAQYKVLSWQASSSQKKSFCEEVVAEFGWPLFVKPCAMGSSVGIHKVNTMDELVFAIEDALKYDEEILVESFVKGREIEISVLENAESIYPKVSVAGEIKVHHPDGFYSYSAKYLESEKTELLIPALLSEHLHQKIKMAAADIFIRLKCKSMARIDFFVDDSTETLYFNEINTLPGFTPISMYPKLWQESGLAYSDLLDELIRLALNHQQSRLQKVTNYL